ncbi:MAG: hypothetical protein KDJ28_09485 [Candidatus Competibacteraceae bacterium]|nr:hypothetical protein [Candidatus Competibacteraceae bacterium]
MRSTITASNAVVAEAWLGREMDRGSEVPNSGPFPQYAKGRCRSAGSAVKSHSGWKGVERRKNPLKTTARRAKWRAGVKTDIVYCSSFADLSGHWRQPSQL